MKRVVKLLALSLILSACQLSESALNAEADAEIPATASPCPDGDHFLELPSDLEGVVTALNSLSQPTSVACFVRALKGPINIVATSNPSSAQPAQGESNPRIFIVTPTLSISVATTGDAMNYVEFGWMREPTRSIKGEIRFPLSKKTEMSDLFSSIQFGAGTDCQFCHRDEESVEELLGPGAYESDGIRPSWSSKVSI